MSVFQDPVFCEVAIVAAVAAVLYVRTALERRAALAKATELADYITTASASSQDATRDCLERIDRRLGMSSGAEGAKDIVGMLEEIRLAKRPRGYVLFLGTYETTGEGAIVPMQFMTGEAVELDRHGEAFVETGTLQYPLVAGTLVIGLGGVMVADVMAGAALFGAWASSSGRAQPVAIIPQRLNVGTPIRVRLVKGLGS